ncbi:ArsR/SmtB family transcription factor [Chondromyces crocatus]|uniref:ArsR family transcriptional regulator n=1 Tax=Chondromyces crocatus TaxID=52 RepID=A0A0K1EPE0_CHOCO|nr:metalloregulator ArsR/SmtB family transcription factor [Chondromyces crocatus]AKT42488.1 ArsR family transcriptional regulator [Chondromyces crocatus]
MVEQQAASLDRVFHALADPTRRAMLSSLALREQTVGELAAPFQISLAASSKHVKVLESAGLVRRTVQGRTHVCQLEARPLGAAHGWLQSYEQFWSTRLDRLEALFAASSKEPAG